MENYNEENEDTEEDETEESDSDYDSSGDEGIAYTVASKADFEPIEVKSKVKTRKNEPENEPENNEASEALAEADNWSQSQQKALESALVQFPKGTTERWERIANKVPSKTKEQCIQRFKTLAEMVKKKKENQSTE